jgi:hypothetical protein
MVTEAEMETLPVTFTCSGPQVVLVVTNPDTSRAYNSCDKNRINNKEIKE